ncbi:MAG: hypothetical protein AAF713_22140 [Pseudomonadota bacterium]
MALKISIYDENNNPLILKVDFLVVPRIGEAIFLDEPGMSDERRGGYLVKGVQHMPLMPSGDEGANVMLVVKKVR